MNTNNKIYFQKINSNDNLVLELVSNIFSVEPFPIYEQNWQHIFSYLSFNITFRV